jgi:DNA-binding PucR family transcriptional regulator
VELGDVFALCDVLANMVGGPVILEDASFRVLAYSSFTGAVDRGRDAAILGRQMPPEWLHHLDATGGLERLRRSNEVVDVSDGPWHARRRLITAVRTAGHMLGVIWVAEGDRPLPGDGASRLREAAALAIPHLLRHQEGYRAQRLRRGELVRTLLEGRGQRRRYADELELPRGAALAVVAFEPESHEELSDDVMDRVADHVSLGLQMSSRPAVVARLGAVIYAILPVPANGDARMLADLGRQAVRRPVPVMAHGLRGAMSTVARGLDVLAALRRQADDALEVLRRRRGGDFVSYDDVRPQVILARVREALAGDPALRLPALEALAEADGADGGWHRSSLDAFLRAGGNVTLAARALDIHATTLRYRLDRVQQVSGGIDLEDDDLRLTLALLLRVGRERFGSSGLE